MAGLHTPSYVLDAYMKTCVLIGGHILIQSLGNPHWMPDISRPSWCVSANYNTLLWRIHNQSWCCVWSLYRGGLNQGSAGWIRVGKQKPICTLIEGPHVQLPQIWITFIALDENKATLVRFLSDVIMIKVKDLPEWYELVTGGGFINATDARSTTRNQIKLSGNNEAADRGY